MTEQANYQGPGYYEHFRGGQYIVHGLAKAEATGEYVVVYTPVDHDLMPHMVDMVSVQGLEVPVAAWTRLLSSFNELVRIPSAMPGEYVSVPRFSKINTEEI